MPQRGDILVTLEEQVKPSHCALLIVDMQNDFCHKDGFFGSNGADLSLVEQMTPKLLRLIEAAQAVGIKRYFIQVFGDEPYLKQPMIERKLRIRRSKDVARKGTWGAQPFSDIVPSLDDVIISKYAFSSFIDTPLEKLLRETNVRTIMVTGVMTECCVGATARHGFMLGFYTIVPEDCVASYDREAHNATLSNINKFFGRVVSSDEILGSWLK